MEFRQKPPIKKNKEQFAKTFDDSICTNEKLSEIYKEWIQIEHDKCKIKYYGYPNSITDDDAKRNIENYVIKSYKEYNKTNLKKLIIQTYIEDEYIEYVKNFEKEIIDFEEKKSNHEALNNIGVPYNLYSASKDDFPTGTMENLYNQKNVLIQGESDTGKSHLSVAFVKYLNKEKNIPLYEMGIFYEEQFLTATYEQSIETYNKLIKIPFLILDDIGSMGIGEHKRELIKGVIFERIRENMPTWITTNSTIGSIYDQRTASKIIGEYTIVKKKRTGTRLENKKEIEI